MKSKSIILSMLPLLLSSCSISMLPKASGGESSVKGDAVTITEVRFNYKLRMSEAIAVLSLDGEPFYTSLSNLGINKLVVAGDEVKITYYGQPIVGCHDACFIEAKVKSYEIIETTVFAITLGEHEGRGNFEEAINGRGLMIQDKYVITDENGSYVPLDEYEGDAIYASVSPSASEDNCTCPAGAECEPCPLFTAGLYAYNPRPSAE
ncbi:MAG: hypothetical protein J6328_04490 [Bacilli bacterium]|nr:hypothetical protein [Bacilli bacterium]